MRRGNNNFTLSNPAIVTVKCQKTKLKPIKSLYTNLMNHVRKFMHKILIKKYVPKS